MTEKIKITKKELDDIYEIEEDVEKELIVAKDDQDKNFTFEEYTEHYDKNNKKQLEQDLD